MRKILIFTFILILSGASLYGFEEWGSNLQTVKARCGDMQNVTGNFRGYNEGITIYEQRNKTFNMYFFFNEGRYYRYTIVYGDVPNNFLRSQKTILSDMYGAFTEPPYRFSNSIGKLRYQNKNNPTMTIIFEQLPDSTGRGYFLQIHFFNPEMEIAAVGREKSMDNDIQIALWESKLLQEKEEEERQAAQRRIEEEDRARERATIGAAGKEDALRREAERIDRENDRILAMQMELGE